MPAWRSCPLAPDADAGSGLGPWFAESRDLLRPVLEHAVAVARQGARAEPPVEPPPTLTPVLRFTSLRGPAIDVVASALDDDEFRERVRDGAPGDVASVLFLERPRGWITALTQVAGLARERAALQASAPDVRRLEKRLEAAETARAAAEAAVAVERDAASDARAALASERTRRRDAEAEAASMADEIAGSARTADEHNATLARLHEDLEASHAQVRSLRSAVERDDAFDPESIRPSLDALRDAVTDARAAFESVDGRVRDLERRLPAPPSTEPASPSKPVRRSPLPVPAGLVAESVDAAHHLVRSPGVVVLVDGYNVTIGRWGQHLGITEQRDRLEQAATSAAARTGAELWIVFDGADATSSAGTPRSLVRVLFSEPGEEADDVIIRLVSEIPAERPVIVVSDDNRVRRGSVAGGANLFTAAQFLEVCGIEP